MLSSEASSPTESRYALLITSSVYDDRQLQELAAPRRDAVTLGRALSDAAVGGFEITRLTNPTSWRAAQAVEEFFSDRQWDDTLLLYFSGHGVKSDGGDLFFAMRNTSHRILRATSLPASFVRDVMASSNSQRQILLLDCCYGGAFAQGLTKGDDAVDVMGPLQGFGRVILTASTALEFAWQEGKAQGQPQQSVFTRVVAEGLSTGEADLDGDGSITVLELHRYASKRIRALRAAQTPTLSTVGQEGELVIGRAPLRPRPRPGDRPGPPLDLSSHVSIRDSGAEGSVVGLAVASATEISLSIGGRSERLSARYAYAKARVLDGQDPDSYTDTGATIPSGLKAAKQFGIPLEAEWPYVPTKPQLPPNMTWAALDNVRPRFKPVVYPISRYEEIPYHLALGRPIVAGFSVFHESWMNEQASKTGWIAVAENTQVIGGHAVVIVGFDGRKNALKFANSWGATWGEAGFGYMPRKAVEQALNDRGRRATNYWAIEVPLDPKHCLE
jgi:hypothetical protein